MPRKEKVTQMRFGDIILDNFYQVRSKVTTTSSRMMEYVQYMKNGDKFPPLVIDKSTNNVICGFTRYHAYDRAYKDPDMMIDVIIMDFKSDREKLTYATRDNATHGQPLTSFDRKNIISRLSDLDCTPSELSSILGMSELQVKKYGTFIMRPATKSTAKNKNTKNKLNTKNVKVKNTKTNKIETKVDNENKAPVVYVNGEQKFLTKKALEHLDGQEISKETYDYIMESWVGRYDVSLINCLIDRIDYNLINLENENVIPKLQELVDKIQELI
ncbi:MAG: hypothetical protein ACE5RH_03405 [Nitrosarchaeum sp.]